MSMQMLRNRQKPTAAMITTHKRIWTIIGVIYGENSAAMMDRQANVRPVMKNQTKPEVSWRHMQHVHRISRLWVHST